MKIAETFQGLPVTELASSAFKNVTSLVKFDSTSINSVGSRAFEGCTNLRVLPPSFSYATEFAEYSFAGSGITAFHLDMISKRVPNYLFYQCKKLRTLDVSYYDELRIGSHCIDGCISLSALPFSDYVYSWESYCCANLSGVKWMYAAEGCWFGDYCLQNTSIDVYVKGGFANFLLNWDRGYSGRVRLYTDNPSDSAVKQDPSSYWTYDSNGFPKNLG